MNHLRFVEEFAIYWAIYWLFLCALVTLPLRQRIRSRVACLLPVGAITIMVFLINVITPWQKLWLGSIGLLFTLKASVLLLAPQPVLGGSRLALAIYMTIWPGMDPSRLTQRTSCVEDGNRFVPGYLSLWIGAALFMYGAMVANTVREASWIGLLSFLLMVHFGYAVMLSCCVRLLGWNVRYLFDRPELSRSLHEFWSVRWNVAFIEMNKVLFMPVCSRLFGKKGSVLAIFAISGLLHELAITYPCSAEFGKPLLYFMIQGTLMLCETYPLLKAALSNPLFSRIWTYGGVLFPAPLLFTESFRTTFILPVMLEAHSLIGSCSHSSLLSLALWCAAAGHFCTLIAGLQVPFRMHWKEELPKLSAFNQKIMLNYAAYVGLTIVMFGCLTLSLHEELMAGTHAAVCVAVVIAVFWVLRLVVDFFYFKHDDWPQGAEFVIGHKLLDSLFAMMAAVYIYIIWLNWLLPYLRIKI